LAVSQVPVSIFSVSSPEIDPKVGYPRVLRQVSNALVIYPRTHDITTRTQRRRLNSLPTS
jgi:hypothetical protein